MAVCYPFHRPARLIRKVRNTRTTADKVLIPPGSFKIIYKFKLVVYTTLPLELLVLMDLSSVCSSEDKEEHFRVIASQSQTIPRINHGQ